MNTETPTVHDLRRRWKPHKEQLQATSTDHPTCIRFHRACSWLARLEDPAHQPDIDLALISQWIAFNCLYGQWDTAMNSPQADRDSWRQFLDRILRLDASSHVSTVLTGHKKLILALLDDKYLSSNFWQEPTEKRGAQSRKAKFSAQTWYLEKRWALILENAVERIYLIRCQLVHGAATHGGQLNRDSLRHCSLMLGHLLPALLLVFIDHGADQDWGAMCYPPLRPGK